LLPFTGLLEKPNLPQSVEELSFKIFVSGKAGIGKTTTIARLAGTVCPSSAYVETVGIRETNVYWPTKIRDKIVLFKLQLWDAGENSIKKYSHILPVSVSSLHIYNATI
jgi:GTPase SAR1 family protein